MASGRDFFDNVTPYVGRGRGRGLLVYAGEEVKKLAVAVLLMEELRLW